MSEEENKSNIEIIMGKPDIDVITKTDNLDELIKLNKKITRNLGRINNNIKVSSLTLNQYHRKLNGYKKLFELYDNIFNTNFEEYAENGDIFSLFSEQIAFLRRMNNVLKTYPDEKDYSEIINKMENDFQEATIGDGTIPAKPGMLTGFMNNIKSLGSNIKNRLFNKYKKEEKYNQDDPTKPLQIEEKPEIEQSLEEEFKKLQGEKIEPKEEKTVMDNITNFMSSLNPFNRDKDAKREKDWEKREELRKEIGPVIVDKDHKYKPMNPGVMLNTIDMSINEKRREIINIKKSLDRIIDIYNKLYKDKLDYFTATEQYNLDNIFTEAVPFKKEVDNIYNTLNKINDTIKNYSKDYTQVGIEEAIQINTEYEETVNKLEQYSDIYKEFIELSYKILDDYKSIIDKKDKTEEDKKLQKELK
jgi:hypothetical protein